MNILLTSVGRRSYLINYFKKEISSKDKIIACNSIYTSSLSYADVYYLSPSINDDKYLPFIHEICDLEKIDVIISFFDIDLPVLASDSKKFSKKGIRFIGPSQDMAIICNDKFKSYEFFLKSEIKTPKTYLSKKSVLNEIREFKISFPLIIKPRWGMGSIGVYKCENQLELDIFYKKCKSDIKNSYLKYESLSDLENSVIIQEYIDGNQYGLDVYKDLNNKYISTIAKKKVTMRSGETDVGEIVCNKAFDSISKIISDNFYFKGLISVDCIIQNDKIYVIEINPRISGHYPFSHISGANYIKQLIEWLNGNETNEFLLNAEIGSIGCKEINPVLIDRSNLKY